MYSELKKGDKLLDKLCLHSCWSGKSYSIVLCVCNLPLLSSHLPDHTRPWVCSRARSPVWPPCTLALALTVCHLRLAVRHSENTQLIITEADRPARGPWREASERRRGTTVRFILQIHRILLRKLKLWILNRKKVWNMGTSKWSDSASNYCVVTSQQKHTGEII